jgi:RNA polymerase nonessential primary-like sigma factor
MQQLNVTTSCAPVQGSIRAQAMAVLLELSDNLWVQPAATHPLAPADALSDHGDMSDATSADDFAGLNEDAVFEIDDSFERYLSLVRSAPRLEPERERGLFLQLKRGDAQQQDVARRALVQAHLWLVPIIVRRFSRRGGGFEDLIAEGNLGLYDAIDRFDVERGLRFSSYAKWWVVHAVTSAMAAHAYPVRLPRRVAQALSRKRRQHPSEPHESAVASHDEAQAFQQPAVKAALDGAAPVPMVVDWSTACDDEAAHPHTGAEAQPEQIAALRQLLHKLADSVKALPERERTVIELRYGLNGQAECTLQQIGQILGLSAERVRTLQISATDMLKGSLANAIGR